MNLILRKQCLPVWLLFPTTFLLLIVFPSQAIAQCFDYDSLDMKNRKQVYCPLVTDFKSSLEKQEKLLTVANSTNKMCIRDRSTSTRKTIRDPNPIKATQTDFLSVIVHELMHGLGFFSGWSNYLGDETEALIPYPIYTLKNGCSQFIEMAFDQYMIVIPQNRNVKSYTDILNKFSTNSCTEFSSLKSFRNAFEKLPQYDTAKTMYKHSITKNSLGFLPRGTKDIKDSLILETGLGTYQRGSSISHVDYQTYTNSSDFLMTFMQDDGVSLQDAILAGGNYKGGAIGPKLKMVLETLWPPPSTPPPSNSVDVSSFATPSRLPPSNSVDVSSSATFYKLLEGSSFHWFIISFVLSRWFSSKILRL
ncbi:hypothetical protein G9A89_005629 [Geosiphon pyriformis]|nr:hypothetical protein G9A89_005629 [Geosiphon pyriformis]